MRKLLPLRSVDVSDALIVLGAAVMVAAAWQVGVAVGLATLGFFLLTGGFLLIVKDGGLRR